MKGVKSLVKNYFYFGKAFFKSKKGESEVDPFTQIVIAILAVIFLIIGVLFISGKLFGGGGEILSSIRDTFRWGRG